MKGRIEHAADKQPERPAFELIGDLELDKTGRAIVLIDEVPAIFEMFERTVDIFDEDARGLALAGDPAREGLPQGFVADGHLGDLNQFAFRLNAPAHAQIEAHGQKFRIFFNIRDEIEHFVGAVKDATFSLEGRHGLLYADLRCLPIIILII